MLETRTQHWPDEAACAASAGALAHAVATHAALTDAFIELHGPLGAGKTTFVRHLLHALGVEGRVKSPTYAVMEPYELVGDGAPFGLTREGASLHIWHFDFYRFNDPQEWEDAGFRDLFASRGLKLVEWPEKAEGLLPEADLRIHIEPLEGDARSARFDAHTHRGVELLA
ncbi:MAG: tRNA (adenosine(37)-N6)-threonylcarbamoyltransferase complex ATPase subunit type 1 TsaE [Burkholderiales bacterium]